MPTRAQSAHMLLAEADVQRIQQLMALVQAIDRAAAADDAGPFQRVIAYAVGEAGVRQADIAREFRIDRSGVTRWIAGTHAPRIYARPAILQWLRGQVQTHIAELQSRPEVAEARVAMAAE